VSSRQLSKTATTLWRIDGDDIAGSPDQLATEEPLEIRLRWGTGGSRTVAVTMRTPGADAELAAGFLYAEGVIAQRSDLAGFAGGTGDLGDLGGLGDLGHAGDSGPAGDSGDASDTDALPCNVLEVALTGDREPELASLERHFFATSACGVCGKAGLETLSVRMPRALPAGPCVAPALLRSLPAKLRSSQGLFDATGGLHAAALFDREGNLLEVREDVGRHNALDKLVGWALLGGRLPLFDHVLLVSGRTSYEILQKSAVAGLALVCSVSAPSSLAVDLARRFGITLVGFLRGNRCNVYSGIERIAGAAAAPAGPPADPPAARIVTLGGGRRRQAAARHTG
jgi:FdhD protein